jgi:hypothetical protein
MSRQTKVLSQPAVVASDRRAAERFASVREAISSPLTARQMEVRVRVYNVSVRGIGLISPRRFERGTTLLIQVQDTGQELPPLFVAKVVHVTAFAKGDWLLGCTLARELMQAEVQWLAGNETTSS